MIDLNALFTKSESKLSNNTCLRLLRKIIFIIFVLAVSDRINKITMIENYRRVKDERPWYEAEKNLLYEPSSNFRDTWRDETRKISDIVCIF